MPERDITKHRVFPGRMPGTDYQFTIRRANPKGVTPLTARERYKDRSPADRRADAAFFAALWAHFGDEPFERGNLDAGRLSWLFGREVVPGEEAFRLTLLYSRRGRSVGLVRRGPRAYVAGT